MKDTTPSPTPTISTSSAARPGANRRSRREPSRYGERNRRVEHLLSRLAATRDEAERERLLEHVVELNLDLCDAVASRYAGRGIQLDDLVQVARLALVVAIRRYRPAPGSSFIGYAVPTMTGELKRYFRDHGWMVRPPRRIQELGPVLRATRERWEQEHGTTPTTGELAAEVDVPAGQVAECLSAEHGYHPLSLDLTPGATGTRPLVESLAQSHDELETAPDRVSLGAALGSLSDRDRELLWMRFVEGRTQKEIGLDLGVSQMQVSRLVRGVVERLRDLMGVHLEEDRRVTVA